MTTLKPGTYKVTDLEKMGFLLVQDGNHGEYRPRTNEFSNSGTAFIRAADMDCGQVLFEKAEKINEEALHRITKGIGKPGDILLSHKGTVGKLAKVPMDAPYFVCSPQTTFWRSLSENIINNEYLYYFMDSIFFRNQLDSRKGETDMAPYVSLTAQRDLEVIVPSISTQKNISRHLTPIDEKIRTNYQTMDSLEKMAKAIFKEWFIDFGPVKAKSDGKKPFGMDDETAALFPDSFEKSEIGMIPKGWKYIPLKEICHFEYGKALKEENRINGKIDVWGSNGIVGTHNTDFVVGPGIVIGRKGNAGAVNWAFNNFWPIDTAFYVTPRTGFSLEFIFHLLKSIDLKSLNSDSAVPGLNRDQALFSKLVVPDKSSLIEIFSTLHKGIYAVIKSNLNEIATLSQTRDLILPKLISGEILLKEIVCD